MTLKKLSASVLHLRRKTLLANGVKLRADAAMGEADMAEFDEKLSFKKAYRA